MMPYLSATAASCYLFALKCFENIGYSKSDRGLVFIYD